MRLLILHESTRLGGGADYAALAATRLLAKAGHRVDVGFASDPAAADPAWPAAVGDAGGLYDLGPGLGSPRKTGEVRRRLAARVRSAPDWVLLSQVPNPFAVGVPPPGTRVAAWVHAHGESCPVNSRWLPGGGACDAAPGMACVRSGCVRPTSPRQVWQVARRKAVLRVLRRADRCLVASGYMADLLRGLGVPGSALRVLPYPIAAPPPCPPAPGPPRALFVGRLIPEKGAAALARAAAAVGLPVDFVGDGPEAAAVAEVAAGSGGAIRLLGWRRGAELEAAWRAAALLVVPSRWPEPFGLVGPEALLRGRPVVAADVGGIRDWADRGGVVLTPPDPGAVARLARELLDDPARLRTLAGEAAAWDGGRHREDAFAGALVAALGG